VANLGNQVLPRREPAADLALRELQQQDGERFVDALEVGEGDQLAGVAHGSPDQPVQPLVGLVLVELEVAGRVERDDPAAAPIGVDPERRLLGHRAARHEHGGGLAEQLANLGLERGDDAAVAVPVLLEVGLRQGRDRGEVLRG